MFKDKTVGQSIDNWNVQNVCRALIVGAPVAALAILRLMPVSPIVATATTQARMPETINSHLFGQVIDLGNAVEHAIRATSGQKTIARATQGHDDKMTYNCLQDAVTIPKALSPQLQQLLGGAATGYTTMSVNYTGNSYYADSLTEVSVSGYSTLASEAAVRPVYTLSMAKTAGAWSLEVSGMTSGGQEPDWSIMGGNLAGGQGLTSIAQADSLIAQAIALANPQDPLSIVKPTA